MKKLYSILAVMAMTAVGNAQIVINEVYSGGGSNGAIYKNDFVELVNIGSTTQTLSGASLMYGSATGVFSSYHSLPEITLQSGQKYLIEMVPKTANTSGAEIEPDYKMNNNTSLTNGKQYDGGFSLAAANGKIALVQGNVQITSATQSEVIDFVGYGTANMYEGSGAVGALSATISAQRIALQDTNDNAKDFERKEPTPENSKASLSVVTFTKEKATLVKNTFVTNDTLTFANASEVKIISLNGQVVKTAKVIANTTLDISNLATGVYIVNGVVNGEKVSQKIIKK